MASPILLRNTSKWLSPFTRFCLKFSIICGNIIRLYFRLGPYFWDEGEIANDVPDGGLSIFAKLDWDGYDEEGENGGHQHCNKQHFTVFVVTFPSPEPGKKTSFILISFLLLSLENSLLIHGLDTYLQQKYLWCLQWYLGSDHKEGLNNKSSVVFAKEPKSKSEDIAEEQHST